MHCQGIMEKYWKSGFNDPCCAYIAPHPTHSSKVIRIGFKLNCCQIYLDSLIFSLIFCLLLINKYKSNLRNSQNQRDLSSLIHVYVHIYACIYASICGCVCIRYTAGLPAFMCALAYMYIYAYVYIHIIYLHACIYMHICICVHMYVHIYICTHTYV